MYKAGRKVIASLLVFILTMAHLSTLGVAIASSLEDQTTSTNVANIAFDVYFKQGENKVHSDTKTIGAENYIYAAIEVKDGGYLKDSKIELQNSNFDVSDTLTTEQISKVDGNKLELNRIKAGNATEIEIPISMIEPNGKISTSEFSKQSSLKLTGTYVDSKGKEKSVEKSITVNLGWTAEPQATIDVERTKYVPYEENGKSRILLQTEISSYVINNILPVKESIIEVKVPTINNKAPIEVKVAAKSTKATNGDETAESFTSENYIYEKTIEDDTTNGSIEAAKTGKLTINLKNEVDENGNIAWAKNATDRFVVTYIYSNSIGEIQPYDEETNTISTTFNEYIGQEEVTFEASNKITVYGISEQVVENSVSRVVNTEEQIGELIDFSVSSTTPSIGKGQLYANYQVQNKIETEYQETLTADIALAGIANEIILETNVNKFVYEIDYIRPYTENQTTATEGEVIYRPEGIEINQSYYKKASIDKKEFYKILGENGEIIFYAGTTQIAKIDKDTKDEDFTIDLSQFNINSLIIKTSKPIAEGKLNFNMQKAIKGDIGYEKEKIERLNTLQLNLTGKATNNNTTSNASSSSLIIIKKVTQNIRLGEPETKVEFKINKESLSTVTTNTDVKMTAILRTDDVYCNLFKNPTIEISIPSCVETINVKNVEVLFDTEGSKLTLKKAEVEENSRTLIITLEGNQTEYTLGAISKGVNVVITSDITLNKLTPNKQESFEMIVTNANDGINRMNRVAASVDIVAPTGVFTISNVSNYVEGGTLTGISEEEKTAIIPIMSEAREVTYSMDVINNYNNTIDSINILGRTSFKGNKDIVAGKDLGSTINMPLTSNITVSGIAAENVKVYYSENGEATKDLSLASNAWTETPANLANVKSYLIVANHTLNTSEMINFSYKAQIPANLQYNESAYETYVVYFNNNLASGTIQDSEVPTKLGLITGKGPVLEANMTSNVAEIVEVLTEGIIKYTLTVKNTGTENANDVIATLATQKKNEQGQTEVVLEIPQGLKYVEPNAENPETYEVKAYEGRVDLNLGTIAPNQTITKDIYMQVDYLTEDTMISNISAIVISSNATQVQTNTLNNTLAKTHFITSNTVLKDTEVLKEGQEYTYNMEVVSSSLYKTRENTVVEIILPQELRLQTIEIYERESGKKTNITDKTTYNYNEKQGKLTIELGDVTGKIFKQICLKTKVGTLADNVYSKEINIEANVSSGNGRKEPIRFETVKIGKVGFKITQSSNIPENTKIAAYEDFKYIFTIENLSDVELYNVKVTDILPEELMLGSIVVTNKDGNRVTSNTNSIDINMMGKETVTMEVNVTANALEENKTISNKAIIEYEGIEKVTSPEYTHIIEKFDSSIIENPEEPVNPSYTQKRIMGTVWLDNNNNGGRDEDEERLSNVEVMLFNNKTAELVRDSEGQVLRQYTDKNGSYTFDKIPQGKYTVIFLYDVANYSATVYRKENVDSTINSDAVDTNITLDGVTRVAAITEEILINDSNIYNIDLGLISNPKFDLKLDKTVSKITVVDNNGTKVYDYKDEKLAKKDLVGKQINNTTIIVEYKIKVTNEGAVAGYVKKIADYMPTEMKFNSELNKDWYTGGNGVLFNSSLANTVINPGETKEVTLTLSKKMTENNLGLYHNEAEIYEAYNDLGLVDMDSKVANKVSNEDDISSADVIITVKTGEVILFVGLSLTIIITIGISGYFIRKKVLR